ncbi:hypothetical protein SAMN05216474_2466 [Lishizhenia tianjinensis]|uniref:Lipoprotein n=1 Tax=Lishizhenia tianjinensis TaxID=477690 RepID=A0A1I7B1M3_9FLAO|nr:hypothetical protein SAMN05216474_2466 [Lishizhenia tianjinensis]
MKLIIFLLILFLTGSCQFALKTFFKIKDPKTYTTRSITHQKIENDLNKKNIDNFEIVYAQKSYYTSLIDTTFYTPQPRIFNKFGQLPDYNSDTLNVCSTSSFSFKSLSNLSLESNIWKDKPELDSFLSHLEYIDSTKYCLDESFDYLVLMDYTTFAIGIQNRNLRYLTNEIFTNNEKVKYIFINKDLIENDCFMQWKTSYKSTYKE